MLEWRVCGVRCRISVWFPASVILMLTLSPDSLTAACLLASLLHEAGHAAAMVLLRDAPSSVTLGVCGMRVERHMGVRLGYPALCAVSLAGPAVNVVCAAVFLSCSRTAALVHAVLALFHLLPVLSLDGGEALYALLCCRVSETRAERVMLCCSIAVLLPLCTLGFWLLLAEGHNFTLLLLCGYVMLRIFLHRGH